MCIRDRFYIPHVDGGSLRRITLVTKVYNHALAIPHCIARHRHARFLTRMSVSWNAALSSCCQHVTRRIDFVARRLRVQPDSYRIWNKCTEFLHRPIFIKFLYPTQTANTYRALCRGFVCNSHAAIIAGFPTCCVEKPATIQRVSRNNCTRNHFFTCTYMYLILADCVTGTLNRNFPR